VARVAAAANASASLARLQPVQERARKTRQPSVARGGASATAAAAAAAGGPRKNATGLGCAWDAGASSMQCGGNAGVHHCWQPDVPVAGDGTSEPCCQGRGLHLATDGRLVRPVEQGNAQRQQLVCAQQ
jgi:hypothetical protein